MLNQLWESVRKQEARLDEKLYESVLNAAKGVQALNERANLTDVELAQAIKMLDAAKRGLGLTNKLTGEDKRKHASRVMSNLNRIRAFVQSRLKAMPEENEEFDFDQFFSDDNFDEFEDLDFNPRGRAGRDAAMDMRGSRPKFGDFGTEGGDLGFDYDELAASAAGDMDDEVHASISQENEEVGSYQSAMDLARKLTAKGMKANQAAMMAGQRFGFDKDESEVLYLDMTRSTNGFEENEEFDFDFDDEFSGDAFDQFDGLDFAGMHDTEYEDEFEEFAHLSPEEAEFARGGVDVRPGRASMENEESEVEVDPAKEALVKKHQMSVTNERGSRNVRFNMGGRVWAYVEAAELEDNVTNILYRWDDYSEDDRRGSDMFTANQQDLVDALRYAWNKAVGYEQFAYGFNEDDDEDYTDVSMRRGEMGIADKGVRESVEGKRSFIDYITTTLK